MLFSKFLFSLSIVDLHTRERHWRCLMTSRQLISISLALYILCRNTYYTQSHAHSYSNLRTSAARSSTFVFFQFLFRSSPWIFFLQNSFWMLARAPFDDQELWYKERKTGSLSLFFFLFLSAVIILFITSLSSRDYAQQGHTTISFSHFIKTIYNRESGEKKLSVKEEWRAARNNERKRRKTRTK